MSSLPLSAPRSWPTARRRRGSILILVLALLSILLILATTLSFTSRLEMAATENFARNVQGRFAALGALGVAPDVFLAGGDETTHFLQSWARLDSTGAPRTAAGPAARSSVSPVARASLAPPFTAGVGQMIDSLQPRSTLDIDPAEAASGGPGLPAAASAEGAAVSPSAGMVHMLVTDESARVNLNAVGALGSAGTRRVADSPAGLDLAAFIAAALTEAGLDPAPAPSLARAIILWRLGPDGQPGEADIDDDGDSAESDFGRNGRDDDGDGFADNAGERRLSLARNGRDDNADGTVDDGREGAEHDGRDNDGDGVVDEMLEGIDEPDEFQPDPALPSRGDDRHYTSVEDLRQVPGVTNAIFAALAPHLTVHSASETRAPAPRRRDEASEGIRAEVASAEDALLDVNRATFEEIVAHLERAFPDRPAGLIEQFALNILDARDPDSIPSAPPGTALARPPLGLERTPFITEVWPDSETEMADGDDGQYVEIVNPWPDAISLDGMRLETSLTSTRLSGTLGPGAMLIVTDDFDESQDDTPEDDLPNYGSFLEIFQLGPNGSDRLLAVDPQFDLPDSAGAVELLDSEGNLLDWFEYRVPGGEGGRRLSFQRADPRVRWAALSLCSPFQENRRAEPPEEFAAYRDVLPPDRPFATPADLMLVFAAWAEAPAEGQRGWAYPALHSGETGELDSRLVDIFSIGPLEPLPASGDETPERTAAEAPLLTAWASGETHAPVDAAPPVTWGREWRVGAINVNTAPPAVLQALPGVDEALARRIVAWRAEVEALGLEDSTLAQAPYSRRGDLLRNDTLWQGVSLRDRLLTYRRFVNAISTSSASLRVEATAANDPGRRTPSTAPRSLAATMTIRDGRQQLVTLRYLEGL